MVVYCSTYLHGNRHPSFLAHVLGGMWKQQYVITAFSRNRFTDLLRYFHIAPPTPPALQHTVIQKIAPLYDHVDTSFLYTSYHRVSLLLMRLWWVSKGDQHGRLSSGVNLLLLAIKCIQWLVMVIFSTLISIKVKVVILLHTVSFIIL